MSDKGCEKLIKQIKRLNTVDKSVYFGTMKTDHSVSIGDITLEKDDLMVNTNIVNLKTGDTVLVIKISNEKYAIAERMRDL